jgi:ribosomal protein L6P/L9E
MHSNNARNWGGSFLWKIRAYHFPKGVNLHVETKTKSSWEISGPKNELKRGGEKNWSVRSWREKNTCIGQSFNEKKISLVIIAIATLSSCQLQQS